MSSSGEKVAAQKDGARSSSAPWTPCSTPSLPPTGKSLRTKLPDEHLTSNAFSFRILHQAEGYEVYLLISESWSSAEALADWHWLEKELLVTLTSQTVTPDEATEFVKAKIESLLALQKANTEAEVCLEDRESLPYKAASERFHRLFNVGEEDKLVIKSFFIYYIILDGLCFVCVVPL